MSAENIVQLTGDNFDDVTGSGTVLVDFWATWCGPCIQQGRILDGLAAEIDDSVTIAKLNVDEAQETAARFGVRSIPTLIVFRDGQIQQQFVGVQNAATLKQTLGL